MWCWSAWSTILSHMMTKSFTTPEVRNRPDSAFRIGYVRVTYVRHWEHCTAPPDRLCPGYIHVCASLRAIVLHFRVGYVRATYVRHWEHCTALLDRAMSGLHNYVRHWEPCIAFPDRLCPGYIVMWVNESIVLHFHVGSVRATYVSHWEHCTSLPSRLCPGYICALLRALYCTSG